MIRIKQAVIVEGKYDKIKLSNVIEGLIVETGGFQIFSDPQKLEYICSLARQTGIVIMTDSDAAGFQIRAKLSSCIPGEQIYHAYIPDVYGKERRKANISKEGKLGVEGMEKEIIEEALRQAGVMVEGEQTASVQLKHSDLYELGLIGQANSSALRHEVLLRLKLPERMGTKALLQALNRMYGRDESYTLLKSICNELRQYSSGSSEKKV